MEVQKKGEIQANPSISPSKKIAQTGQENPRLESRANIAEESCGQKGFPKIVAGMAMKILRQDARIK